MSMEINEQIKKFLNYTAAFIIGIFAIVVVGLTIFQKWLAYGLESDYEGDIFVLEVPENMTVAKFGGMLEENQLIRSGKAFDIYARRWKNKFIVNKGKYEILPGMHVDDIFIVLNKPVKNLIRIPDGWWIHRVGKLLEEKKVCSCTEYIEASFLNNDIQKEFEFLPKNIKTLEGYLYPDTYDFPENFRAELVIRKQLKNYSKKVVPISLDNKNFHETLILASLLELEGRGMEDKRLIAGVIQNRLKKKMKLELCSTALYSMNEWRELKPNETSNAKLKHNTYHSYGLPSQPVCSPSLESIQAALKPAKHNKLFFVYLPESKKHYFSRTFKEHKVGIRLRQRELIKLKQNSIRNKKK